MTKQRGRAEEARPPGIGGPDVTEPCGWWISGNRNTPCEKERGHHGFHAVAAQQREGAGPRWTVGVDEFGEEHIDAARDRPGLDRREIAAIVVNRLAGKFSVDGLATLRTIADWIADDILAAQQREGAGE